MPSPSAGRTRACCFFVLWCPNGVNFTKSCDCRLRRFISRIGETPISCGFARCSYEPTCRFLTLEIAVFSAIRPSPVHGRKNLLRNKKSGRRSGHSKHSSLWPPSPPARRGQTFALPNSDSTSPSLWSSAHWMLQLLVNSSSLPPRTSCTFLVSLVSDRVFGSRSSFSIQRMN